MRTSRKSTSLLVGTVLASAGLLLAACGGGTTGTEASSAAASAPAPAASSAAPAVEAVDVAGIAVTPDPAVAALLPADLADGIRAVTSAPYPPFEMFDDNQNLIGLDIDLGNALAVKLGAPITWESIDYNGVIPAVQAGKYDMVLAAMGDSPDREKVLDFVNYSTQGYVLIVPKGNPEGVMGITDMCGRKLAVEAGNHNKDYFNAVQAKCKADGKEPMTVTELPKAADALLAVKSGNADAQYLGISTALDLVKTVDGGNAFETVAPEGRKYGWDPQNVGVGLPKSVAGMTDAVLAALTALQADGTLAAIFDKYGVADMMIPTPVVNTPLSEPLA